MVTAKSAGTHYYKSNFRQSRSPRRLLPSAFYLPPFTFCLPSLPMKLNLTEKQTFYHELGQFLKSGIALPQAVEALAPDIGNRALRQLLVRLQKLLLAGETVASAFAQLRPTIGDMEVALISASSHTGRLEHALSYLSDYFGTLGELRATIIKKLLWPLIELHIGVLLVPIVPAVTSQDWSKYGLQCASIFAVIYALGIGLFLLASFLVKSAQTQPGADRLLRMVPLVGALRRNMALNRFCATYEMQMQAAINMMDGLRSAAEASQSALIRTEIERIIPKVRAGSSVAPLLAGSRVFPSALQRVFRIGEETGSLDEDLRKWADYYRKAAVAKMEALGSWLPRIITFCIVGYMIYAILTVFQQGYIGPVNKILQE